MLLMPFLQRLFRSRQQKNKSIDAITSATIVPESLRVTAISTGFTDSKAKKVLFVVGDPRFESSLEGFLVNSAINFLNKRI